MDARLGGRDPLVRHRRRLRRRQQRARSSAAGAPTRQPEGLTLTTKVFHSTSGDPADNGLAPDRIRRQLDGSLERLGVERIDLYLAHEPDAADAARRHGRGVRAAPRRGPDRRLGPQQLRRRRDPRGARHRPAGARPELLLAARPRRRARRAAALRRARHRLRAVRPALRRLADGQVPPRRAVPGRLADDPAPRAVRAPRRRRRVRRPRAARGARRRDAASTWRRSRSPGCSRTRSSRAPSAGPAAPEHLAPVLAARDLALSAEEHAQIGALFA